MAGEIVTWKANRGGSLTLCSDTAPTSHPSWVPPASFTFHPILLLVLLSSKSTTTLLSPRGKTRSWMILINVFPGQMVKLLSKRKSATSTSRSPSMKSSSFTTERHGLGGDCFWVPDGSVQASTKQVTLQNSGAKPPPRLSTHLTHWASFSRMCVAK